MAKVTTYYGDLELLLKEPSSPLVERLEWLTDINSLYDGSEERKKLRSKPRQVYSYKVPIGPGSLAAFNHAASGAIRLKWAVPIWTESQSVGNISGAQTVISCDTLYRSLRPGLALLRNGAGDWQLVRIASVTSTSVTLSSGASAISNASILPVRICTLVDTIKKSTNGYDEVYEYDFEVEDLVDIEPDVPTQYIVGDLYYDETLAETGRVDRNYQKVLDRVDFDLGRIAIRSPSRYSRMGSVHRAVLTTAQEVWLYREFLYRRAGRYEMFWAPTFEQNLRVVTTGTIGSTIRVENDGYQDYEAREHLAFQGPDKAWYIRQVTASADAGGGRLDLTLDASLGLDAATLLRVCYLSQYRLDTDSVELRWVGNGAVVSDYALIQSAGGLENETMLGESTIWPDVAAYSLLQKTKLRVGDRQKTLDTGLTWGVLSLAPTVWAIIPADEVPVGDSTIWPDCADASALETDIRLGDRQKTLDTGYVWEVVSVGPTVWKIADAGAVASVSALPSSDVKTGAVATIKGDAWTYKSGSWSSPPITISSWASRPRGSLSYDGRAAEFASGGVVRSYRYSATAEEWVPPEVWRGTVTLRGRIDGDAKPDAESPAWTDTVSNSGTITTDGTRVTWQANTNDNRTALSILVHGVSAGKYYLCGYISAANVGGTNPLGVTCRVSNGSYVVIIASSTTPTNGWRFCTNLASPATFITTIAGAAKSAATERWAEVLVDGTTAWLFVDHELVSFAALSSFTASAATTFVLGENTSNSRGDLLGRDLKFLTY